MAGLAARRRTVMFEFRGRIAMAPQAEVVKARLGTDQNRGSTAAVTADAGIAASPIGEVVMALDTVDFAVFVVRKVYRQPDRAPDYRLAQCQQRMPHRQWKKDEHRRADAANHHSRMAAECQRTDEARRSIFRFRAGSCAQQSAQGQDRHQYIGRSGYAAVEVSPRGENVDRKGRCQYACHADVHELKPAMLRIESLADGRQ